MQAQALRCTFHGALCDQDPKTPHSFRYVNAHQDNSERVTDPNGYKGWVESVSGAFAVIRWEDGGYSTHFRRTVADWLDN